MNMIKMITLCALAACVGLVGCASAPPEHHEYLLRPQPLAPVADDKAAVLLRPVSVAPYLDQSGIVLETADAEIRVAKHHQWAESLNEAIGRFLQVGIGNRAGLQVERAPLTTGTASEVVTVRIDRLHGDTNGTVRLVADWSVEPADGPPRLYSFDQQARQSADGYAALVATQAELLDQLAGAIADALN